MTFVNQLRRLARRQIAAPCRDHAGAGKCPAVLNRHFDGRKQVKLMIQVSGEPAE